MIVVQIQFNSQEKATEKKISGSALIVFSLPFKVKRTSCCDVTRLGPLPRIQEEEVAS